MDWRLSVDFRDIYLIDGASMNILSDVIRAVEHGADINFGGDKKALHYAIMHENIDMIDFLVKKGADLNYTDMFGSSYLHWASKYNKSLSVQYLLDKDVDINAVNGHGWTSLHIAIQRKQLKSIEILLKYGADVTICTTNGISCLNMIHWLDGFDMSINDQIISKQIHSLICQRMFEF